MIKGAEDEAKKKAEDDAKKKAAKQDRVKHLGGGGRQNIRILL